MSACRGSFWKPRFNVLDADKKKVLKIEGPCCIMNGPCCTCDTDFQVITEFVNKKRALK